MAASLSSPALLARITIAITAGGLLATAACGASSSSGSTESEPTPLDENQPTGEPSESPQPSEPPPDVLECSSPLTEFCMTREQMERQAKFGTGQIPLDPPRTDEAIASGFDDNDCMKPEWTATGCCNPAVGPGVPQGNGECCYMACELSCCGRPFVVRGVAIVASAARRNDWATVAPDCRRVSEAAAQQLGQAWLIDALAEHASVASFAVFTLELMQLGAPPELVRGAQRAGLDEIEHARHCFGLASHFAGEAHGPGNLPACGFSPRDLADTLRAAVHEGCIGETIAAAIVSEQARHCTDATVRRALERIAEDELSHSELAWRFVAWAIAKHGAFARRVVLAALDAALAHAPEPENIPNLPLDELHAGGRINASEWSACVAQVTASVLRPAIERLQSASADGCASGGRATANSSHGLDEYRA